MIGNDPSNQLQFWGRGAVIRRTVAEIQLRAPHLKCSVSLKVKIRLPLTEAEVWHYRTGRQVVRLTKAEIRGWGRLADAKINLDSKLIAVVGPNESGKTTLLQALAYVDREDVALEPNQRSRAVKVLDTDVVTRLIYVLDDDDRSACDDLDLAEAPTHFHVGKTASGRLTRRALPTPRKSTRQLQRELKVLKRVRPAAVRSWVDRSMDESTDETEDDWDPADELQMLIEALDAVIAPESQTPSPEVSEQTRRLHNASGPRAPASFTESLGFVLNWLEMPPPGAEVASRLWNRSPDLVFFDEEDRSLSSSYELNPAIAENPPAALANLADAARLDLPKLVRSHEAGDVGQRDSALIAANSNLESLFEVWKQSKLTVRLSIDGGLLRITVLEDDQKVTIFDERSAGLRTFVALITFLHHQASARRKILLIDEAENHLHVDAQADLIDMFASQEQAEKVIYTTHSPACLPPDLGTGIRAIVAAADPKTSEVQNNFWGGHSAGLSPLMLAMGASAAAFTPARFVVIAEGASDMILLPSLIRAATGAAELPYQISSGLSEAPKDLLAELDLEAARVAYLLDGDPGGACLARDLSRAGIPSRLIIELRVPGAENLLNPEDYTLALSSLVADSEGNGSTHAGIFAVEREIAEDPAAASWAKSCEAKIVDAGLKPPSKVAVANWLVQNGRAEPSKSGRVELRRIHRKIRSALRIPDSEH